jgi:hypothetical protein
MVRSYFAALSPSIGVCSWLFPSSESFHPRSHFGFLSDPSSLSHFSFYLHRSPIAFLSPFNSYFYLSIQLVYSFNSSLMSPSISFFFYPNSVILLFQRHPYQVISWFIIACVTFPSKVEGIKSGLSYPIFSRATHEARTNGDGSMYLVSRSIDFDFVADYLAPNFFTEFR